MLPQTYRTSEGRGLAAIIWDASENLRDREGAGLDSMLATSRVLVGAIAHEIRNLASAAAMAYAALKWLPGTASNREFEALGNLIRALEKIAVSGLQVASQRKVVVTDLAIFLNEFRIVIETFMREAELEVTLGNESQPSAGTGRSSEPISSISQSGAKH
jgi:two-component system, LuxR family, sensor kinase FixL